MSLTDRIKSLEHDCDHYDKAIKDAREELWDANYVRRNDERRKGESEEHWKARRKRNRQRYKRREQVIEHLIKKRKALEKEADDLREHRREYHEEQRGEHSGSYEKGSTSIVTFDGKSCVEDLAYWLNQARQHGWHGVLVSGYRTPAYSTSLCYGMCGAPYLPRALRRRQLEPRQDDLPRTRR